MFFNNEHMTYGIAISWKHTQPLKELMICVATFQMDAKGIMQRVLCRVASLKRGHNAGFHLYDIERRQNHRG